MIYRGRCIPTDYISTLSSRAYRYSSPLIESWATAANRIATITRSCDGYAPKSSEGWFTTTNIISLTAASFRNGYSYTIPFSRPCDFRITRANIISLTSTRVRNGYSYIIPFSRTCDYRLTSASCYWVVCTIFRIIKSIKVPPAWNINPPTRISYCNPWLFYLCPKLIIYRIYIERGAI